MPIVPPGIVAGSSPGTGGGTVQRQSSVSLGRQTRGAAQSESHHRPSAVIGLELVSPMRRGDLSRPVGSPRCAAARATRSVVGSSKHQPVRIVRDQHPRTHRPATLPHLDLQLARHWAPREPFQSKPRLSAIPNPSTPHPATPSSNGNTEHTSCRGSCNHPDAINLSRMPNGLAHPSRSLCGRVRFLRVVFSQNLRDP